MQTCFFLSKVQTLNKFLNNFYNALLRASVDEIYKINTYINRAWVEVTEERGK